MNPRCPKCSYALIFLERRLRYKCSICGKSYLQKEVEHRTFRQWNLLQRKMDRAPKYRRKRHTLEEKLQMKEHYELRGLRHIFKNKFSEKEQKQRLRTKHDSWKENNPDKMHAKQRRRFLKHKTEVYTYQKAWRRTKQAESRLKQRLCHWRTRQVQLAKEALNSFSIFGLPHLLKKE